MPEEINMINARYVASAVRLDQYPEEELSEIVFIGRSNVGKSSLINSITRHGGLARVSGAPGKTQTINFYRLTAKIGTRERRDFYLVDLPGYGYARAGKENRRRWAAFIEEYLVKSARLKLICQLVDGRHAPMTSDLETFAWLRARALPLQVIATKADKLSRTALQKNVAALERAFNAEVLAYSAVKGTGRAELLDVIAAILLK